MGKPRWRVRDMKTQTAGSNAKEPIMALLKTPRHEEKEHR
jgi:hypothetical protein